MAPAVLQAGRMRRLHPLHWLALALLAWSAVSYFWSVDSHATLAQVRGYVQEMMIAWFVWELTDSPDQTCAICFAVTLRVPACWRD